MSEEEKDMSEEERIETVVSSPIGRRCDLSPSKEEEPEFLSSKKQKKVYEKARYISWKRERVYGIVWPDVSSSRNSRSDHRIIVSWPKLSLRREYAIDCCRKHSLILPLFQSSVCFPVVVMMLLSP